MDNETRKALEDKYAKEMKREKRFSPGRWGGSRTKSPRTEFRISEIDVSELNAPPGYTPYNPRLKKRDGRR